ncbi:MAG: iron-containing alcohol dehydrogenase [Candidatus Omnitrophica bacterium]|nr:iron-containing alcohol dehydrogenase [Candidatus Omnitrophota bacterium]
MHSFFVPTKIVFGRDTLDKIKELISAFGRRVLIITGKKSMQENGILDKIKENLSGFKIIHFNKINFEPTVEDVDEARRLSFKKVDLVIGLGGGSVLDCAKATAGLLNKKGRTLDYLLEKRKIEKEGIPFVAIPTTAGSGAEVTPNAVLIDRKRKIKMSLRSFYLFAKLAILDPTLTLTLPPKLTAYSGMDALSQAIESYVSKGANHFTDALAIEAIKIIGRSIIGVYKNGEDLSLRENMLYGSLLSGIALFNARMGVVHGLAHPLGVIYKLPHGLICGLLLPYAMEFNLKAVAEKYKEVAIALNLNVKSFSPQQASLEAIKKIRYFLRELKFPQNLKSLGVKKKDFLKIIKDSLPSGSLKANPIRVCSKDLKRILECAWEGGSLWNM